MYLSINENVLFKHGLTQFLVLIMQLGACGDWWVLFVWPLKVVQRNPYMLVCVHAPWELVETMSRGFSRGICAKRGVYNCPIGGICGLINIARKAFPSGPKCEQRVLVCGKHARETQCSLSPPHAPDIHITRCTCVIAIICWNENQIEVIIRGYS